MVIIYTMNDYKNFVFNDGVHSDYDNFFWVYNDMIEFYMSDDFFISNFFDIVKSYREISFNDENVRFIMSDQISIVNKINGLTKNINHLVHIYK